MSMGLSLLRRGLSGKCHIKEEIPNRFYEVWRDDFRDGCSRCFVFEPQARKWMVTWNGIFPYDPKDERWQFDPAIALRMFEEL